MEAKLIGLGVETFKIALYLSMPMLMTGLIAGLAISIFQATTQIQEQTLSFVPKLLMVFFCLIVFGNFMLNVLVEFTRDIFDIMAKL